MTWQIVLIGKRPQRTRNFTDPCCPDHPLSLYLWNYPSNDQSVLLCHGNYIAHHILITVKIIVHKKTGKSFVNAFMAKDTRGMRDVRPKCSGVARPHIPAFGVLAFYLCVSLSLWNEYISNVKKCHWYLEPVIVYWRHVIHSFAKLDMQHILVRTNLVSTSLWYNW